MTNLEKMEIINDTVTMLSNYKTSLSYDLDEEFGNMTEEEIRNSEDNLETAVGALLGEIEKTSNCIIAINQIKQDLKIYNNVMKLIKDLFELMYIGNEFDEYFEVENYYIHEFGTNSRYFISESLFEILNNLNTISQKLEVKKDEKNKKSN